MKYRKQAGIILAVSIILLGVVFLFGSDANIVRLGFCEYENSSCTYNFGEGVFVPIELGFMSLGLVSLILLFTRESTYLAWRRFAIWAVPIGAILLFLVPSSSGGGIGISGPDIDKEIASWIVSILFLVISLIIIVKKSLSKAP